MNIYGLVLVGYQCEGEVHTRDFYLMVTSRWDQSRSIGPPFLCTRSSSFSLILASFERDDKHRHNAASLLKMIRKRFDGYCDGKGWNVFRTILKRDKIGLFVSEWQFNYCCDHLGQALVLAVALTFKENRPSCLYPFARHLGSSCVRKTDGSTSCSWALV